MGERAVLKEEARIETLEFPRSLLTPGWASSLVAASA